MNILFIILFMLSAGLSVLSLRLEEKFEWKVVDYNWPSEQFKQNALDLEQFIPLHNVPVGIERWQNKLFLTITRLKAGIPSTLNYIDLSTVGEDKSPKLNPYPSWNDCNIDNAKSNKKFKNTTLISAYRVQVDECDRLWVLDDGKVGSSSRVLAPPSIVIFDLKTDELLRRFEIPSSQYGKNSHWINIVVDSSKDNCGKAHAYAVDTFGKGLIVYSYEHNRSHRIDHEYFQPGETPDFFVDGLSFTWSTGIFGLAVGPHKSDGSRDVYFHALSSTKEYAVSNKDLQSDGRLSTMRLVGDRGSESQSTTEVFDKKTNSLFSAELNKNGVSCWNINKPLTPENVGQVDSDPRVVFPNDIKLDSTGKVWVLANKLSTYLKSKLKSENVNFRVFSGNTENLVKGTPCEK